MQTFKIEENYPLASLTTFELGGPARYYACVDSDESLHEALEFARSRDMPLFILGKGSNVLISDDGFEGLVIHNCMKGIARFPEGENCRVRARSGEDWQNLVDLCVSEDLQGIECLAGIPGAVGASPVQNIGAYGQEVSDTIVQVEAIEISTNRPRIFRGEECEFGYRASIFNSSSAGRYFITDVTFMLTRNGRATVTHKDLANLLNEHPDCTLRQVRDCAILVRSAKGLLVREGHERFRCAGSFFKNPVVSAEKAGEVEAKARKPAGGANWFWPLDSGEVKISAAGLIQGAGFPRGYRKGNVGLSTRHALVVTAHDSATAWEVVEFAAQIQRGVKEKFNIFLGPEIRLVGFPPSVLEP